MRLDRLTRLREALQHSMLIKKKENLLYLTGRSFLHGYLLVKPKIAKKNAKTATRIRQKADANVVFLGDGLEKVEGIHSDFLKNVGTYIKPREILEVFGEFTYAEVKYIKYKNPGLKLKVVVKHDPVDHLRTVKDAEELRLIRKSMLIVEAVFKKVRQKLASAKAITEIELAKFIRQSGLKLGAEDVSFPPIVASGPNAAVPHHVPGGKKLKFAEPIILDFGFKYKNYCSDFTRTVFLKSAPKKLAEAYRQVERAYVESMAACEGSLPGQPRKAAFKGIKAEIPYQKAVEVLAEKKLDKYFIHSLGHGTGLEIHELPNLSPKSNDILEDGMVFSIEPGVYIPKIGGIRIEDLVYLENGRVKKFINIPTGLKENVI